jgi:NAD(P)-dependent dehydrogenase (short-subunit alcohol dehydrogenase family)
LETKPTVLITGAGSGIGAATSIYFSQNGHDVILVGRRKETLTAVASKLKTKAHVLPADVRREPELSWLIHEALKVAPNLGILVNNAGIFEQRSFLESDDDLWVRMFETHLLATVRLSRLLMPHFQKRKGGSIVNVASTAGLRPVSNMSAYATMKASMIYLSQALALEVASDQIRVNVVCPGVVETPILKLEGLTPQRHAEVTQSLATMHPLGRMGKPEEVAWAIFQLASEQAAWVTGAVLSVDGGIALT